MESDSHKTCSVYMEKELWVMLDVFAKKNVRSKSQIINDLVREFIADEADREIDNRLWHVAINNGALLEKIERLMKLRHAHSKLIEKFRDLI
jgi:metal-responsive CopG/Arc/MetJ family transcriptional regulator